MAGKFLVSLTNAKNDADKATVGFVVANAAVASGQETVVFLNVEGAYLGSKGYADDIHEEGFAIKAAYGPICRSRRNGLGMQSML